MSHSSGSSRPTEASEATEFLRLVYRSLLDLPEGDYHDSLMSWRGVIKAYSSGHCPMFVKDYFKNVITAIDLFVEDWLNPEEEVKHLAVVLQTIFHELK